MKINRLFKMFLVGVPLVFGAAFVGANDTFIVSPEMGKVNFDARLRYEDVDAASALQDAEALTIRFRLGYLTPTFKGLSAFAELESTTPLGGRDYNDLRGHGADRSVIADPDNNELNQAWVSYAGFDNTLIKLGRQRIIFDNSRFVGNVGWRQNEQTFDALLVENNSLPDTVIAIGFIDDIKGITGTHSDVNAPIVNVKYSGLSFGDINGYGYFLDFDAAAATDRDTLGLRFNGSAAVLDGLKVLYTAEYAQQDIHRAVASDEQLDYYFVEAGFIASGVTIKISREVQEAKNGASFKTPLGTNHLYNGWADQFLTTPVDGLEDTFLTLSTKFGGVKWVAVYHDFKAEDSGIDYGDELDLLAVKKFGKHYKVLMKYAMYDSGDAASGKSDKDKLWIQGEVTF